jgi:hypothetical protein
MNTISVELAEDPVAQILTEDTKTVGKSFQTSNDENKSLQSLKTLWADEGFRRALFKSKAASLLAPRTLLHIIMIVWIEYSRQIMFQVMYICCS